MAKRVKELSAKKVTALSKTPGRHPDGLIPGLYLQVRDGNCSWVFRYQRAGRDRTMGLGSLIDFSLKEARERARKARQLLAEGHDPLETKSAEEEATETPLTFKAAAEEYVKTQEVAWKNPKHRAQWRSTLETYVYPVFGDVPINAVHRELVLKAVQPLWTTKHETASRIRGRIEKVLGWAKAKDLRSGDNPAAWKENLCVLLPKPRKVKKVRHHPALPFREMPQFMAELRAKTGISARALEFTILCATRTNETIGATDNEFDFTSNVWVIPGERTKTERELRIPLSDRAIEILMKVPREPRNRYVFIGGKAGEPLSNMAMLELLRGMRPGLTVHGTARSSFRDWAAEVTNHPDYVVEMALGHKIKDETEAAYRRGDLLNKRRELMDDWARFCAAPPVAGAKILPMRGAR